MPQSIIDNIVSKEALSQFEAIKESLLKLEAIVKRINDAGFVGKNTDKDTAKLQQELLKVQQAEEKVRQEQEKTLILQQKVQQEQKKTNETKKTATKLTDEEKRALAEANKIKKLQNDLNAAAKGSYNQLNAQYKLNVLALNKMTAAQRQGTVEGKKLESETKKIKDSMIALNEKTSDHTLKVGRYSDAMGGMKTNLTNATGAMSSMPGPMGRVVTGFKQISAAAKAFLATPIGLVIAGFVAAGAVVKKIISTSKDYEAQMDRVQAITGATAKEIRLLSQDAKLLGRTTTKTATEVGELQEEFAKLGFSTKEILNATKATIALSEATGSDLANSATIAANTIRGFGMDASETNRIVDVMAESFTSSALDLTKFSTGMSSFAPIAKAYDVSIEKSTALLGILSDAGIDASTAGTSLRNIFLALSEEGLTFEEAMQKIDSAEDKAATSLALFGKRGAVAGLVLAENSIKIGEFTTELENAAGAADNMAGIVRDNLQGDLKMLSSAWEGLFLTLDDGSGIVAKLGRGFIQALTSILTAMSDFKEKFINGWNSLIKGSKLFRISLVAIPATVKLIVGQINAIIYAFVKSFVSISKVIGFALTGQFKAAKEEWGKTKDSISTGIKDISASTNSFAKTFKDAFTGEGQEKFLLNSNAVINSLNNQAKAAAALIEREKALAYTTKLVEHSIIDLKIAANDFTKPLDDQVKASMDNQIAIIEGGFDEMNNLRKEQSNKEIAEEAEKDKAISDKKKEIYEASFNLIAQIAQASTDKELTRLKELSDAYTIEENAKLAALEEKNANGIISDDQYLTQKAQIEQDYAAMQDDIVLKQNQAKERQFNIDKALAISKIAINTAIEVSKSLAFPVLIPFIIGLGAVQIAAVAIEKFPAYEHGGIVESTGPSLVSEKRQEIGVTKEGDVFLTPEKPALMMLEKGTTIYPDANNITNNTNDNSLDVINNLFNTKNISSLINGNSVYPAASVSNNESISRMIMVNTGEKLSLRELEKKMDKLIVIESKKKPIIQKDSLMDKIKFARHYDA